MVLRPPVPMGRANRNEPADVHTVEVQDTGVAGTGATGGWAPGGGVCKAGAEVGCEGGGDDSPGPGTVAVKDRAGV